jgi:hypothetical protein
MSSKEESEMNLLAAISVPVHNGAAATGDWKVGVVVVAVTMIAFAAAIVIGNHTSKQQPSRGRDSEDTRHKAA